MAVAVFGAIERVRVPETRESERTRRESASRGECEQGECERKREQVPRAKRAADATISVGATGVVWALGAHNKSRRLSLETHTDRHDKRKKRNTTETRKGATERTRGTMAEYSLNADEPLLAHGAARPSGRWTTRLWRALAPPRKRMTTRERLTLSPWRKWRDFGRCAASFE